MTFASNICRGLTLGALTMGLVLTSASAQNGTNYQCLNNGFDAPIPGVGAGGTQTKMNGIGIFVPGEDLRGSHITALGDFGWRNSQFRELACPLDLPAGGGPLRIWFRGLYFFELDGLNGNNQVNFLDPACPTAGPSFPLGAAGIIPFGVGVGMTGAFTVENLPAGVGPVPSAVVLLPNNGLVPSATNVGTATPVGAASNISIAISSSGFCWGVQFTWTPSALALNDDIDGLWHYVQNSPDGNQYWGMSNDEVNIWQSNTMMSDDGPMMNMVQFAASFDYDLLLATVEPNTMAALAPRSFNLAGSYYAQTENVTNENGVALNPNIGFDVGAGGRAISFSGTAGVVGLTGTIGNQNVNNNPGTTGTLGFMTWDNGGDLDGSVRVTFLSIDIPGFLRSNPDTVPDITKFGGQIRVPLVFGSSPIAITLFGHFTSVATSGWPDPDGFPSGTFGVPAIAGASWQLPTGPQPAACTGTKLNITYGTSGRAGVLGAGGPLTWDPSVADTSGTKQLFLFN